MTDQDSTVPSETDPQTPDSMQAPSFQQAMEIAAIWLQQWDQEEISDEDNRCARAEIQYRPLKIRHFDIVLRWHSARYLWR